MLVSPELILWLWFVPVGLCVFLPLVVGGVHFMKTRLVSKSSEGLSDESIVAERPEGIFLPEGVAVDRRDTNRMDRRSTDVEIGGGEGCLA